MIFLIVVLNNRDLNTDQNNHDDGKWSVFCLVPFSSFWLLKALYVSRWRAEPPTFEFIRNRNYVTKLIIIMFISFSLYLHILILQHQDHKELIPVRSITQKFH